MRKAYDLRALTFGAILSRGFSLYVRNFPVLLGIYIVTFAIPLFVAILLGYVLLRPFAGTTIFPLFGLTAMQQFHLFVGSAGIFLLVFGAEAFASFAFSRAYNGDRPIFRKCFQAWIRRAPRLLIAAGIMTIVCGGVSLALTAIYDKYDNASRGWSIALSVMILPAAFTYLFASLFARYRMAGMLVMLEDIGALASFRRVSFLTRDGRWKMVGLTICMGIVLLAFAVPGIVLAGLASTLREHMRFPHADFWLKTVTTLFWLTLFLPLFLSYLIPWYYDLRCRKEAFDIAVLAGRFGLSNPYAGLERFVREGYVPDALAAAQAIHVALGRESR